MPTIRMLELPPPSDWEEFEHITWDALILKWKSPNLQRHGRQGQPQHGVDIYGPDYLERHVGVQCKNTPESVSRDTLTSEIGKAEKFEPQISAFYLAVSAATDAALQLEARKVSAERIKEGKFPVGVLFWQDILREIVTSDSLLKTHYSGLSFDLTQPTNTVPNDLAILDIAYSGLNIEATLQLLFGELPFGVQEDPTQIVSLTLTLEACAARLFAESDRKRISDSLSFIRTNSLALAAGQKQKGGWRAVRAEAKAVAALIDGLKYGLHERQLALFKLGVFLSNWWHAWDSDDRLSNQELVMLDGLLIKVTNFGIESDRFKPLIDEYQTEKVDFHKMHVPNAIYNRVASIISSTVIGFEERGQ